MRWKSAAIVALLLVAPDCVAAAERPHPPRTLAPGVLRVGTYFVNPPFEYLSKGKKVGFEVDLVKAIAGRLNLRPLFVSTQWESILRQMQENHYDCIIGGITITDAREQILGWSHPYMTTTLSVIVNSARTPGIRSLADLKDATVGVQAATTDYNVAIGMQIRGEIKSVKVYPFDRIGDAISDLANGQITAVIKVYPVAAWLARKTPALGIVAQIPHDPQPLGIGFDKNNSGLLAAVNGVLANIKQDGTYARLAKKWAVPSNGLNTRARRAGKPEPHSIGDAGAPDGPPGVSCRRHPARRGYV
jgi:ABC-type amino acid transport substrate-binding protein